MKKRGFAGVVIILLVVIALAVAGGIWYYKVHNQIALNVIPMVPSTSTTVAASPASTNGTIIDPNSLTLDTSDWGRCTNAQYGYEIEYPPTWTSWGSAQDWYQVSPVNCEGQQIVTFSPKDPGVERVEIIAYPATDTTPFTSPYLGDQTVDDVYAGVSSSSDQIFQFSTIDGEKALWSWSYNSQITMIESSALVHHGDAFYKIDYFKGDATSSSMNQNEIDFQAIAESLKFLQ